MTQQRQESELLRSIWRLQELYAGEDDYERAKKELKELVRLDPERNTFYIYENQPLDIRLDCRKRFIADKLVADSFESVRDAYNPERVYKNCIRVIIPQRT